jgi:hypothetical protein
LGANDAIELHLARYFRRYRSEGLVAMVRAPLCAQRPGTVASANLVKISLAK